MKRLICLALIFLLAVPIFAQEEEERVLPYGAMITSVKIYLGQKNKDFAAARELLTQAIEHYEDPIEAYYWLGVLNSDKAEYEKMMKNFNKFKEICARAQEENNKDLKNRCKKDDMREQIDKIIQAEWEANLKDGVQHLRLADSLSGVVANIENDSTRNVIEEGIPKMLQQAVEEFEVCTMLDSSDHQAWKYQGIAYERLGQPEKAVKKYEVAYQLAPDDLEVLRSYASTLYELREMEEAAKMFDEVAEKDTANVAWALTYAAICYQSLGQRDKMKEVFDRILEVDPNDAQIHYQRGIYYIQKATSAEMRDSLSLLDSLVKASPTDASLEEAKQELIQTQLDYYNTALPDFEAAAELDSTTVDYQYWYGTAAYFTDDLDLAQKVYEQCVSLDPEYKDCWCGLELIYARLNLEQKYEEAKVKCEGE
jgi:tetratricopeptide (TPR) repeat protein